MIVDSHLWLRVIIQDDVAGTMGGMQGLLDKNGNLIPSCGENHRAAAKASMCQLVIVPKTNVLTISTNSDILKLPYVVSAVVAALFRKDMKWEDAQVVKVSPP